MIDKKMAFSLIFHFVVLPMYTHNLIEMCKLYISIRVLSVSTKCTKTETPQILRKYMKTKRHEFKQLFVCKQYDFYSFKST